MLLSIIICLLHTPRATNAADKGYYNCRQQIQKLGWTYQICLIVGIVHTNDEEYMHQYGTSMSLIAAPVISLLCTLTI
jgi:hypothetical protein